MSIIFKPSSNLIIKRNKIEFDPHFHITYKEFIENPAFDNIKKTFSNENYRNIVSFQIAYAISHPYVEDDFARRFCKLLYTDIIDGFEFKDPSLIPSHLEEIPENKPTYDKSSFEDLDVLKYKLFNNIFFENIPLTTDEFLSYMKRPNELWLDTTGISYGVDTETNFNIAYILFIFFTTSEGFYLVTDRFALEFWICSEKNIQNYLTGFNYTISLREFIEIVFSMGVLKEIDGIKEKYIDKKGAELDILKDILACINLDDAFKNGSFSGEIRDGKPASMEVSTHTNKRDIQERKEKLGPYRKIETNTEDDSISSLKVTKRFRYK